MKTLSALIVGGALTLGVAMAQDAPKSATAPATQTKVKKHRKHHAKKGATAATPANAAPAATPATATPKK